MYRKFLTFLLAFSLSFTIALAKEIPFDVARQVAIALVYEKTGNVLRADELSLYYTDNKSISSNFYIFELKPQGFVVVSADDIFLPIVAYSFDQNIDLSSEKSNVLYWFNEYIERIDYLKQNKIQNQYSEQWQNYTKPLSEIEISKNKVETRLNTPLWNQDAGWNMYCPADPAGPGGHVYAGCVATAMSIIMKYWNYPFKGTGQSSYYHSTYGTLSANYGEANYMYEFMYNNAVTPYAALLMYHCGVSVQMNYSPDGSGAYSWMADDALRNYFKYSQATYAQRSSYTEANWFNLIKNQINTSYPVYYSGSGSEGGHAFVVDGYRTDDDKFYFNFGWSGYNNGWYTLADAGGFPNSQACIYNIYPNTTIYPYSPSPQNFTVKPDSTQFEVFTHKANWEAPQGNNQIGYELYVADTLIDNGINASALSYDIEPPAIGTYSYCLRAKYPNNGISLGVTASAKGFFNVSFKVKNQSGSNVKDANVTFRGETKKTNLAGNVSFNNIPWCGNEPYTVVKDNLSASGVLNVYKDLNITVIILPTANNELVARVIAFPNPTTQYIYFQGIDEKNTIRIFDIAGKLQLEAINVKNNEALDISQLKTGAYLLEIETAEYKNRETIIVR